ncbi:hypothetical protein [uncultured Sunxiuqinia sp.]|uniref:hypothetical protein n=1 Tax=uncultured Sunxiuqinia sp. TaxID=1573825 RepID=UPI002AA72BB5|nr:hypothetical protein [uncultured Sunxiuqinia sp.]
MKLKATNKLMVTIVAGLLFAISSCKTCKCPAYSQRLDEKEKIKLTTPSTVDANYTEKLILNDISQIENKHSNL